MRNLDGLGDAAWANYERVRVLEGGRVGIELKLDAIGSEGLNIRWDGPVIFTH